MLCSVEILTPRFLREPKRRHEDLSFQKATAPSKDSPDRRPICSNSPNDPAAIPSAPNFRTPFERMTIPSLSFPSAIF